MIKELLLVLGLCLMGGMVAGNESKDSIGIEQTRKKAYILHKVEAKETLYALSRRYQVPIEEIIKENPVTSEGLKLETVLRIPLPEKKAVSGAVEEVKIHRVNQAETMYSIARTYGVSTDDLRKWNGLQGNELKIGQELKIYRSGSQTVSSDPTAIEEKAKTGNDKVHIVQGGETLFRLSQLYEVSIRDLIEWNNLQNNSLEVGQKVLVSRPENFRSEKQNREQVADVNTIENTEKEKVQTVSEPANETDNQVLTADRRETVRKIDLNETGYERENLGLNKSKPSSYKKIVETGLAEVIDGQQETKKYLALHRDAPIGTIMQVKNEMNSLSVFVRVIGNLPNTGANDKIKIKISKTAYDRLGAIDPKFPVEISYVR